MVDKDTIKKFSEECSDWLGLKNEEYQDPILMGGVMMKATLELYLSCLSEEDTEILLQTVLESIPEIKRQQSQREQFFHTGNKVLH